MIHGGINTLQLTLSLGGVPIANCILDLRGNRKVFVQFSMKLGEVSLPRVRSRGRKTFFSLSVGDPYTKLPLCEV